jgi:hypothetical protein
MHRPACVLLCVLAACSSPASVTPDGASGGDVALAPDAYSVVPHRAFPQVVNGGGHLLTSMRLVIVTAPGDPLAAQLGTFCSKLVTSQWWSTVTSEYALGAPRGCVHLVGGALASPATLDDMQMRQYIASAIDAAPSPPSPDGQTMYLLYLPPGVQFAGNNNCSFNGYHEPYLGGGDGWGVVMRCQFDFSSMLESLTIVGSHEVLEAATDPDGTTGWGLYPTAAEPWTQSVWLPYSAGYPVEVADFCISTHVEEDGVWYQRSLSNVAAAKGDDPCVPALPVPYYSVTIPHDWYAIAPGQSVDIPITGWSTAPTDRWEVVVTQAEASTPGPPTTRDPLDTPTATVAGVTYHTLTSGETATLHVSMGAGAVSGTWRTFWITSFRLDATGADGVNGDDHDHLMRVGVYVP